MVYFEASDLEYGPNVKNWMNSFPKEFPTFGIELIGELIEFSLKKGYFHGFICCYLVVLECVFFKN